MAQIPTDSSKSKFWSLEEDTILIEYIRTHGEGHWNSLPIKAGLKRRGKSCRLRWFNYLHPNIKRGKFSGDEEELIIKLHRLLGNRWSLIAKRLPGRTDNDVKNYWNTHMCNKLNRNSNNHPSPTHPPLKKPSLKRREESCRLGWFNHLHPNVKRGNFSGDEEELIIRLHRLLSNRWSLIAKRLPGLTENDVKNYWNTHLCKQLTRNNDNPTHPPLKKPCKDCYWNSTAADKGENTNMSANGKSIAKCEPCENRTFTETEGCFLDKASSC